MLTSLSALTVRENFPLLPKRFTRAFSVGFLSTEVVYVSPTDCTETAMLLRGWVLETDSEITLPR